MIIENCKIIENNQVAKNIWRMVIDAPSIAQQYKGAGQFISLSLNKSDGHILRRPMSIASVDGKAITIIYKVFGEVTKNLTSLNSTDSIELLGPLGNTFNLNIDGYTRVLIGGGIGLSPILNLDDVLRKNGNNVYTIIGAKSGDEHFIEHDTTNNYYLSSDDGSVGINGNVIDALSKVIDEIPNPYIYACGPEIMLKNLKLYLKKANLSGQFSVESYMACGFGFCQGCAISNDTKSGYSLVCKEGPVFDHNEVKFA